MTSPSRPLVTAEALAGDIAWLEDKAAAYIAVLSGVFDSLVAEHWIAEARGVTAEVTAAAALEGRQGQDAGGTQVTEVDALECRVRRHVARVAEEHCVDARIRIRVRSRCSRERCVAISVAQRRAHEAVVHCLPLGDLSQHGIRECVRADSGGLRAHPDRIDEEDEDDG